MFDFFRMQANVDKIHDYSAAAAKMNAATSLYRLMEKNLDQDGTPFFNAIETLADVLAAEGRALQQKADDR